MSGARQRFPNPAPSHCCSQLNPPIPLTAVARLDQAEGPSEIRRVDQQRAAVISASPEGMDLASIGQRVDSALAGMELPGDADYALAGGESENGSNNAAALTRIAPSLSHARTRL